MISKNKIKLIKSLALKKYRLKYQSFLVEGDKNVSVVLNSAYHINELYATDIFYRDKGIIADNTKKIFTVSETEIKKASLLKQPQNALAICSLPPDNKISPDISGLSIYLDGIQDPGNLGTIIRICDWFGIEQLLCSPNTVDIYNPKVIQSTMGSFCRVNAIYTNFKTVAGIAADKNVTIFGTSTTGKNIYSQKFPDHTMIIMGNEGNGISDQILHYIDHMIKIPSFSKKESVAESLNVAVATGIICSEFRRNKISE